MAAAGYQIGVRCPGCGSELTLASDFFLLTCDHCSSRLRVNAPDGPVAYFVCPSITDGLAISAVDRHCREGGKALSPSSRQLKRLLYPYWKIDAVRLARTQTISREQTAETDQFGDSIARQAFAEKNFSDSWSFQPFTMTTAAGAMTEGLPATIGYRADYIRLLPLASDRIPDGYDLLPVTRKESAAFAQAVAGVASRSALSLSEDGGSRTSELHLPVYSLVYFPYLLVEWYASGAVIRYAVDGITGRVSDALPLAADPYEQTTGIHRTEWPALTVELHRCDQCGEDLPSARSYWYQCENCGAQSVVRSAGVPLRRVATAAPGASWVPFWVIDLSDEAVAIINRLARATHPVERLFWPAFGGQRTEQLFRLARRASMAGSHFVGTTFDADQAHYLPVVQTAAEAEQALHLLLLRMKQEGGDIFARLPLPKLPRPTELLFVPFRSDHYQCTDLIIGAVTFELRLQRTSANA